MLRYVTWAHAAGVRPFPVQEACVYRYLRGLRLSEAAPSAASAFVSALAFAHHVLGLAGAGDASSSQRVKGAAFAMHVEKKPLKQRDPIEGQHGRGA